jgi:hypothetical protein
VSDHRIIRFKMVADPRVPKQYRNPLSTDWSRFKTELGVLLGVLACGTRYHRKSDHHVTMKHLRNLTFYIHLPDIRCFDYLCSFDLALFSFFFCSSLINDFTTLQLHIYIYITIRYTRTHL